MPTAMLTSRKKTKSKEIIALFMGLYTNIDRMKVFFKDILL